LVQNSWQNAFSWLGEWMKYPPQESANNLISLSNYIEKQIGKRRVKFVVTNMDQGAALSEKDVLAFFSQQKIAAQDVFFC